MTQRSSRIPGIAKSYVMMGDDTAVSMSKNSTCLWKFFETVLRFKIISDRISPILFSKQGWPTNFSKVVRGHNAALGPVSVPYRPLA